MTEVITNSKNNNNDYGIIIIKASVNLITILTE